MGMTVVARNYRTSGGSGEIDLIAWDNETLVFVEVKCRATGEYGPPDRAIGLEKEQRIVRAAKDYARRAGTPLDQIRFDTVNVVLNKPPFVDHHRDVFTVRTTAGA
jgi:putative endonuclease